MTVLAAATRPTRRDALRHPFRSLAAILLVAIPVALLSYMFIVTESGSSSTYLSVARTSATYQGGTCTQDIHLHEAECTGAASAPESERDLLEANLPEGFSAELTIAGTATLSHGERSTAAYIIQSPRVSTVSLPDSVMAELGAGIGDTITLPTGAEVPIGSRAPSGAAVFPEPVILDPAGYSSLDLDPLLWGTWEITGPEPFAREDMEALNAVGFTVSSRDLQGQEDYSVGRWDDLLFGLLGLIPFLIVALLALMLMSPVFTISVSRQTRTLALLAAQGATPRHIRLAVLVYGLFAGVTGAVLGGIAGVLGASAWWVANYPEWPLIIPWQWILLVMGLALVGATASAFFPAVLASRSSIISGVQGGSVDKLLRWRSWMLIGPVLLLSSGAALLLINVFATRYSPVTDVAKMLCVLAAVLAVPASTPALVWVLGGLRGPLVLRLAARDLRRQSMRSVPAIAALAALIMVYSAVQTNDEARMAAERSATASVYPAGTMLLSAPAGSAEDLRISDIVSIVGPVQRIDVYGHRSEGAWVEFVSSESDPADRTYNHYIPALAADFGAGVAIASPELLEMFGVTEPGTTDTTGTVYTSETGDGGTHTFSLRKYDDPSRGLVSADTATVIGSVTARTSPVLPALYPEMLVSPEAFRGLGVPPQFLGSVLIPAQEVSTEQMMALSEQVNDGSRYLNMVSYEWGDPWYAKFILGGIVLMVMGLVLALSAQQIRRQRIILEAVGAAPGTARAANALFGALCAFTAGAFGLLTGYLGALAVSTTTGYLNGHVIRYGTLAHTLPDWGQMLLLLVVVPLLSAALGWVLTPKAELPEYRT